MQALRENIIGVFGVKGQKWLSNISNIISILQKHWHLDGLRPVENMTYHYVAKAHANTGEPVILKIGCSQELIETELYLLRHFEGRGMVRVIDHHPQHNALLLQQAVPGVSLKSLYPERFEYVVSAYIDTVNRRQTAPTPEKRFHQVSDWLDALDTVDASRFPDGMLDGAISLRDEMLSTMGTVKLLHGDLHLDNILKNGDAWLAIDPKGVLGDVEFELAAFDFVSEAERLCATKEQFAGRIRQVANHAHVSYERLLNWTFIRLVLSAAWSIQDKGDPEKAIFLAELLMR